jgi:molecular chaperone HscB
MDVNNYFELYDLPVSFHPDEKKIREKYYELSRNYHPDQFESVKEESVKEEAFALSTLNNKAYHALSNFKRRVAYILELEGLLTPGDKFVLPPDFLSEMMDLNEQLAELQMGDGGEELIQTVRAELEEFREQTANGLKLYTTEWDNNPDRERLLKIREFYHMDKYLNRLEESLENIQENPL